MEKLAEILAKLSDHNLEDDEKATLLSALGNKDHLIKIKVIRSSWTLGSNTPDEFKDGCTITGNIADQEMMLLLTKDQKEAGQALKRDETVFASARFHEFDKFYRRVTFTGKLVTEGETLETEPELEVPETPDADGSATDEPEASLPTQEEPQQTLEEVVEPIDEQQANLLNLLKEKAGASDSPDEEVSPIIETETVESPPPVPEPTEQIELEIEVDNTEPAPKTEEEMTREAPPVVIRPEGPKPPPPLISPVFVPERIQVQHEDLEEPENDKQNGHFDERMQSYQHWAKNRKQAISQDKDEGLKKGCIGLAIVLGSFFICCLLPYC
ncbi:MAG: hypothetical protein HN467_00275 [Opitutae bacterium]|nr:hypothetical protein [Opitutae bacterium]